MSGINFWVNNPDFRLFRDDEPTSPTWCAVSQPLVEWGDQLLARLARDPVAGKVGFAKWKLVDRYCRLYCKTTAEHRAETNLDNHPCLHQALLTIWQKLEDVEVAAAIPELDPPLRVLPAAVPAVVEPEPEPVEEVSGILIGLDALAEEADRDADRDRD